MQKHALRARIESALRRSGSEAAAFRNIETPAGMEIGQSLWDA